LLFVQGKKGWEGVKYLQEVFGGFFSGLHVDDVMR
jgi:hypothetical protein